MSGAADMAFADEEASRVRMAAPSAFVDTAPHTRALAVARQVHRAKSLGLSLDPSIAPETILFEVSVRFGVSPSQLLSKDRHKSIARARHVAAWLMRQTGLSFPEIGRALGGRDHTTAMNSVRRVEACLSTDPGDRPILEGMLQRRPAATVRLVLGAGMEFEPEARS
jgi:chromosomal replication initiation ATPase DnaA